MIHLAELNSYQQFVSILLERDFVPQGRDKTNWNSINSQLARNQMLVVIVIEL